MHYLDKLAEIEAKYEGLTEQLGKPEVLADQRPLSEDRQGARGPYRDCREVSRVEDDQQGGEGYESAGG